MKLSYTDGKNSIEVECDKDVANHCEAMAAIVVFANAVHALQKSLGGYVVATVAGPAGKTTIK